MDCTILTFNLDGRPWSQEERLNRFIDGIKSSLPDIILVQEGTRLTIEKLLREMGYLKYKRFIPNIVHQRETRELIFSKFPISEMQYIEFRMSSENRGITIAKVELPEGKYFWICTSQFDNTYTMSRKQINELPKMLRNIPGDEIVIFGGDTKILEYYEHEQPEGWDDIWYEAGLESQKYTVNSDTNLLAPTPMKDRPDRIWVRQSITDGEIICKECKFFGENEVMSSHFGVLATFHIE